MAKKQNKENNGFKACPFCGRADKVVVMEKNFFYALQGEHDTAAFTVKCERCEVEMWEHTWSVKKYEQRMALVRRKWNKRAAVPQEVKEDTPTDVLKEQEN